MMKCTQCGCEKLINLLGPFDSFSFNENANLSGKLYVCSECGHLEGFVTSIADDYKNAVSQLESSIAQLNEAKEQLLDLENRMSQYDRDVQSAEKELKSLDITVRRQLELQSKLQVLQLKTSDCTTEISTLKKEVARLEGLERALRHKISLYTFIE